ncbi:MAG: aconitase family protein, partial [Gaiellales bacterium]
MGQTAIEKVLARTSGRERVTPGDIVVCQVDRAVLLDMQFSSTAVPWRQPLVVADPTRVAVVLDHGSPAPSRRDAEGHRLARQFCDRFGVADFFDIGRHGICHQIIAENGLARPGELLLCSDSHTCAGGAFNTAARGVGGIEMLQIACTGSTWFVAAASIKVTLIGELGPSVEGKDAFLALARDHGSAENRNLEFVGSGVTGLSLHDRRTIATQCAEIN